MGLARSPQQPAAMHMRLVLLLACFAFCVHAQSSATDDFFEKLQGTWVGTKGFNIVALPSKGSKPSDEGDFLLLVQPYIETLTFTNAGAPALNRGGDIDQYITALTYEQRVSDADTNGLLHIEEGMFLNLSNITDNNGNQQPVPTFNVARSGTIPHGDSIMLLGKPPVQVPGAPEIPEISSLPTNVGPNAPGDYNEQYMNSTVRGINVATPSETLLEQLREQEASGLMVAHSSSLSMSSSNGGAVSNIPFIVERADATRMDALFFLERMRVKETGEEFDQLQYIQMINLDFHESFGNKGLIGWPHVTINTLVRQ